MTRGKVAGGGMSVMTKLCIKTFNEDFIAFWAPSVSKCVKLALSKGKYEAVNCHELLVDSVLYEELLRDAKHLQMSAQIHNVVVSTAIQHLFFQQPSAITGTFVMLKRRGPWRQEVPLAKTQNAMKASFAEEDKARESKATKWQWLPTLLTFRR